MILYLITGWMLVFFPKAIMLLPSGSFFFILLGGIVYTIGIMLIGFVALEVFAEPFAGIFGLSGETKQLCVSAMRVISISYMFAGANIAFQGIFQALDSGLESLIISIYLLIL